MCLRKRPQSGGFVTFDADVCLKLSCLIVFDSEVRMADSSFIWYYEVICFVFLVNTLEELLVQLLCLDRAACLVKLHGVDTSWECLELLKIIF